MRSADSANASPVPVTGPDMNLTETRTRLQSQRAGSENGPVSPRQVARVLLWCSVGKDMTHFFLRFVDGSDGQKLIEYALLLGFALSAGVFGYRSLVWSAFLISGGGV